MKAINLFCKTVKNSSLFILIVSLSAMVNCAIGQTLSSTGKTSGNQKFVAEIQPLAGEKWYGAYTAKAFCNTPFKDLSFQPYLPNEKKKI